MRMFRVFLLFVLMSFSAVASANFLGVDVSLESGATAPTSDIDITVTIQQVEDSTNVRMVTLTMLNGNTISDSFIFGLDDFSPLPEGNYTVHVACDTVCPNVLQSGYYHEVAGLIGDVSDATQISVLSNGSANVNVVLPLSILITGILERHPDMNDDEEVKVTIQLLNNSGTSAHDSFQATIAAGETTAAFELNGFPYYEGYQIRYVCGSSDICPLSVAQWGYRASDTQTVQDRTVDGVIFDTFNTDISNIKFVLLMGFHIEGTIQFESGAGLSGTFTGEISWCRYYSLVCNKTQLDNIDITEPYTYRIPVDPSSHSYQLYYSCTDCPEEAILKAYTKDGANDGVTVHVQESDQLSATVGEFFESKLLVPPLIVQKGKRITGTLVNSELRQGKPYYGTVNLYSASYPSYAFSHLTDGLRDPLVSEAFSFLVPDDGGTWKLNYSYICYDIDNCTTDGLLWKGYYGEDGVTKRRRANAIDIPGTDGNYTLKVVDYVETAGEAGGDITPIIYILLFDEEAL